MHSLLRPTIGAFLLSTSLFVESARADEAQPGPFLGGWRNVTVTRSNGTTFTATLYYPATAAAQNASFDAGGAPYPAISFGHGFLQPVFAYQGTLTHLATWGYFVIAAQSEGGLFPSHANFASDLSFGLDWLELENANAGSPYHLAVDAQRFGMSGHSMGGGASVLATAADPRVKALANLAAAETSPSAIAAMTNLSVPVSLISGSQDGIVPLAQHGLLMYAAARAPRLLPVIQGGWHCGFEDTPGLGGFGCDSGTLDRATQLALTRRLLTTFFNLYLKGDQAAWPKVWGVPMATDPLVATTYDPGSTLSPYAQRRAGSAGTTLDYLFTLTNTSNVPQSFTLFESGHTFPVQVVPGNTGPIAPGQSIDLHVLVDVPPGPAGTIDRCTISARSDLDHATRSFCRLGARRL